MTIDGVGATALSTGTGSLGSGGDRIRIAQPSRSQKQADRNGMFSNRNPPPRLASSPRTVSAAQISAITCHVTYRMPRHHTSSNVTSFRGTASPRSAMRPAPARAASRTRGSNAKPPGLVGGFPPCPFAIEAPYALEVAVELALERKQAVGRGEKTRHITHNRPQQRQPPRLMRQQAGA